MFLSLMRMAIPMCTAGTSAEYALAPGVKFWLRIIPIVFGAAMLAGAAPNNDNYSVLDFGAKGDGKTDDTPAFQKALEAAGRAGGGVVYAPRGTYFFSGHLDVPRAVTLKGVWESVPAHNGVRDDSAAKPTDDGTTFLLTENQGNQDGPPFILLNA